MSAALLPVDSAHRLIALIDELRALPNETEWVEFKQNTVDSEKIGQTISAIANSSRLADRHCGYMVWGISDDSHSIVGTSFSPHQTNVGNQSIELWLANMLMPSPTFKFQTVIHPDGKVVLLEIPAAATVSVKFKHIAYIRIGSNTPKLTEYPQREESLLSKLRPFIWEKGTALSYVSSQDVVNLLDHASYFALTRQPEPETRVGILEKLAEDRLIEGDVGGRWNILNLGAILFARRLDRFETVSRKALRLIQYDGTSRIRTKRRQDGGRGYAAGFEGLLGYIDGLLPADEQISVFREDKRVYPQIAIRELVANALIHQDMTINGTGPMVEVFSDRIEITNPGEPITDMLKKLFGARPQSRNEKLADLMRKMRICEEQGSGLIKVVSSTEDYALPAPDFQTTDGSMKATLFGPRSFGAMSRIDRVRIGYQHTALLHQLGRQMTNATLRLRFGIEERNAAQVSRVIKDCISDRLIRVADPERPKAGYVPYWA